MFAKELSKKETLMSRSISRKLIFLVAILLVCVSLISGGCDLLSAPADPDAPDGQFTSQEQALESDDGDGDIPLDESDIDPVALTCPKEMTEFVLFVSHTWDFSPNRDLESMKVNGQTEPSSPCPFSVAGSTVIMEECHVPITNTGFIKTDDGPCDIQASGEALITIEEASCDGGLITMTIIEVANPDVGSGAMNCPNMSQPFFAFFPYSLTTREFFIKIGGFEATEFVDPDLSGQFMYNKSWTVHGEGYGSPLPED
jgi:hypothetical protein